jgi:hypothetical protein
MADFVGRGLEFQDVGIGSFAGGFERGDLGLEGFDARQDFLLEVDIRKAGGGIGDEEDTFHEFRDG